MDKMQDPSNILAGEEDYCSDDSSEDRNTFNMDLSGSQNTAAESIVGERENQLDSRHEFRNMADGFEETVKIRSISVRRLRPGDSGYVSQIRDMLEESAKEAASTPGFRNTANGMGLPALINSDFVTMLRTSRFGLGLDYLGEAEIPRQISQASQSEYDQLKNEEKMKTIEAAKENAENERTLQSEREKREATLEHQDREAERQHEERMKKIEAELAAAKLKHEERIKEIEAEKEKARQERELQDRESERRHQEKMKEIDAKNCRIS